MSYDKKNRNPKETTRPAHEAAKLKQLAARRQSRGTGEVADWSNADAALIATAVCTVTSSGCTIQFGYTRDSGALTVCLYDGNDRTVDYIRPTEDIDLYLRTLVEDFAK